MNEEDFLTEADTGDILLFKTNSSASSLLTRAYTWCEFDHVAMVLKIEENEEGEKD